MDSHICKPIQKPFPIQTAISVEQRFLHIMSPFLFYFTILFFITGQITKIIHCVYKTVAIGCKITNIGLGTQPVLGTLFQISEIRYYIQILIHKDNGSIRSKNRTAQKILFIQRIQIGYINLFVLHPFGGQ